MMRCLDASPEKLLNNWLCGSRIIDSLDYYLKMGNDSSLQANDSFLKQDWEPVQRLPQFQIWQNKKDPSFRVEQYEISTQTDTQLSHQKRMFQLRRRSPLLIAAYYFQSQSSEQFCSTHSRHLLYLERIPIRLQDIEHVPYPDYLHLYENCLKGFAQLARSVGYFPVDEGMIGFNERGVAKVWLSEDFAKSKPFSGRVTEENMIRSLIECIERNVDSDQLPRSVPSVRNYLYRNVDALNFDTAIWEFMEFVSKFNAGRVPSKLECIQKAGGIYVIANRQQYKYDQQPARIEQRPQPYGQQYIPVQYQQNSQNRQIPVNSFKPYNPVKPYSPEVPINNSQQNNQFNSVLIERVKNNNWSVEKENTPNRPVLVNTNLKQEPIMFQNHQVVTSPRNAPNLQRQLFNQHQELQYTQTAPQLLGNPRLPQNPYQPNTSNLIKVQSNKRIKFGNPADSQVVYRNNATPGPQPYQIPVNHSVNHTLLSPRSSQMTQKHMHFQQAMSGLHIRHSQGIPFMAPSPQNQYQVINQPLNRVMALPQQQFAGQSPQFTSPTPTAVNQTPVLQPSEPRVAQVVLPQPQPIQVPPIIVASSVPQQTVYTPRSSNIIKYTVEVTPGKVIPQKSSTILRKSSLKNSAVESSTSAVKEGGSLLDNCFHKIATSEKEVERESSKMIRPSPIPERSQHLQHQQGDFIRSRKTLEKQGVDKHNEVALPNKLKISEAVVLVNPSDEEDTYHPSQETPILSQRVAVTTTSYEVQECPANPPKADTHSQEVRNDYEEGARQQLMSVWTAAGNHKSPINQTQSEFNPAVENDYEDYNEQAQFQEEEFSPQKLQNQPVSQIRTEEYQQDYDRYGNLEEQQIRQTANFSQQPYVENNYDEKEIRETGYFKDYQNQFGTKPTSNEGSYLNSFSSPNQYGYYEYNDYDSHGLKNQANNYGDYKYGAAEGLLTASQGVQQDLGSQTATNRLNIVASKGNYESAKEPVEYKCSPSSGSYSQYLRNLTGQIYTSDEMDYVHSVASKNPNYSELTSFQYYRPGLSTGENYAASEGEYAWQG